MSKAGNIDELENFEMQVMDPKRCRTENPNIHGPSDNINQEEDLTMDSHEKNDMNQKNLLLSGFALQSCHSS